MQTHSIIQSSANVIRITNLLKGNVYKRINKKYSDSYESVYGIVQDIMNDGDKTFIEAIEYTKDWSSISSNVVVFSGNDDLHIFPTTPEEIEEYFKGTIRSIEKSISEAEKELDQKAKCLKMAKEFVEGELAKKLTVVQFAEVPQKEFVSLNS